MNNVEQVIHETLLRNSSLFLRRAVAELPIPTEPHLEREAKDQATVACVFVQVALELATKARVLSENGLAGIVDPREHAGDSQAQLEAHFDYNSLKTKSFESLRQHMAANPLVYRLSDDDHSFISLFQTLRNRLVHMNYHFGEADLFDLNDDMVYLVVHTIPAILGRTAVFDFFVELLGRSAYLSLVRCPSYVALVSRLARERGGFYCRCIECGADTADFDLYQCRCCGADWSSDQIGKADCRYCGKQKSVIYDRSNLDANSRMMPARCLVCDALGTIYECPRCNEPYDVAVLDPYQRCAPGKCVYYDG